MGTLAYWSCEINWQHQLPITSELLWSSSCVCMCVHTLLSLLLETLQTKCLIMLLYFQVPSVSLYCPVSSTSSDTMMLFQANTSQNRDLPTSTSFTLTITLMSELPCLWLDSVNCLHQMSNRHSYVRTKWAAKTVSNLTGIFFFLINTTWDKLGHQLLPVFSSFQLEFFSVTG